MARRRLFALSPIGAMKVHNLLQQAANGVVLTREGLSYIQRFVERGGQIKQELQGVWNQAQGLLGGVRQIIDARPIRRGGQTRPNTSIKPFPGAASLSVVYKTAEVDTISIHGKAKRMTGKDLNRHRFIDNISSSFVGASHGRAALFYASTPTVLTSLQAAAGQLFGSDATQRYKFQIQDMTNRFMIHNMDRVTAFLEVTTVMPTVDTGFSPGSALAESANAARFNTSTGTTSIDDLDFSVTNSYMRRFWRPVSVKNYKLPPGHTLKLLYQQDGFYPTNEARLSNAATHLKGQTVQFILRAYSAPVRDGITPFAVTLGTVDLAITQSVIVNYAGQALKTFTRFESNELPVTIGLQNTRMLGLQGTTGGDNNNDPTNDTPDEPQ